MTSWPPPPVLAHGLADAGAFPVPIPVLLGVALGVVAAAAALPGRTAKAPPPRLATVGAPTSFALRTLTVVLLAAIVVPAAWGSADAATNPAPRLLFTVAWAGVLLASALFGPWWAAANPLALAVEERPPRQLPIPLGVWPAVAALVAFGIAEQVLEPSSVIVLATVGVYLVAGCGGALLFGSRWLETADPVHVTSSALGSLAPFGRRDGRATARSPRAGAADAASPAALAVFLGALIGINLFDAAGPQGGLGLRLVVFLGCVGAGGAVVAAAARPSFFAIALIPAAAGHLGAHYLAPLLVDTQVAAVLASDPLRRGWNLLGLTGQEIVAEPIPPTLGLALQAVLLIAGHALAMVVANDLAARRLTGRAAKAALFPVRAAIVASLVAGVYLRFGAGA